jgi:hypothetical protein
VNYELRSAPSAAIRCTYFSRTLLFCQHFENKSGKTKELILRFSALLLILQGYALWTLQMTLVKELGALQKALSEMKTTIRIIFLMVQNV